MSDRRSGGRQGAEERPAASAPARSTWQAVVRRQNLLHLMIALTGASMLIAGAMVAIVIDIPDHVGLGYFLIGEGVAFIMIGFVGIVMSFTTQDIAQGIKETVRENGTETREAIVAAVREEGTETREAIVAAVREEGTETREAIVEASHNCRPGAARWPRGGERGYFKGTRAFKIVAATAMPANCACPLRKVQRA